MSTREHTKRYAVVPVEDIETLRDSLKAMSDGLMRQEKLLRDFGLHEDRFDLEAKASLGLQTIERVAGLPPLRTQAGTSREDSPCQTA